MNEMELADHVKKLEARNVAIYPKRFYHAYRDLPDGSKRAVEMVEIAKRGTNNSQVVPKRWKDVAPVEKEVLEPYYEAWKKNETAPIVGTPLDTWTADAELVQVLNGVNIRSVEDFAAMEDHYLVKLAVPNGREKQRRARAFLENQTDSAKVSAELAAARTDNEALRMEVAELKALMEQHSIKKERRGRPRKQPIEAVT